MDSTVVIVLFLSEAHELENVVHGGRFKSVTCGQKCITMWLTKGMKEPLLKFGLGRIRPDSLRQLLDVAVVFLEAIVMVQARCV